MSQVTKYTRVSDFGQVLYAMEIPLVKEEDQNDIHLTTATGEIPIHSKTWHAGNLYVELEELPLQTPLNVTVNGHQLEEARTDEIRTITADEFQPFWEGDVAYRLFSPKDVAGPRPLVLFLHGSGESGTDNWKQLVGCYGPTALAEAYPDCYIMAPQARKGKFPAHLLQNPEQATFENSYTDPHAGWNRDYLAKICDLIRNLIAQGKVDANRVYVTGMSMGGAGTIRALSVGADLFAAGVPICPSMNPETYHILCNLTRARIWVAASYIDHCLYRHKYLVDGILHLRDEGNQNARLTLYSPEDLAKYGIGTKPGLTMKERFAQNHACWIPTYHNEFGIISWMMDQIRP